MRSRRRYRIAIWVLSLVIIIQCVLIIALIRPKRIPKVIPPAIKGKIAIVLDDWGYNLNNLDILGQIKYPLTISVLPNLNYSKEIAEEAHLRGFEAILHLPMEPREKVRLEKNTIMASMGEATIKNILAQDLADIPYVKGVSNHMGSRATGDNRVMEIVLGELNKRNLYFLDSFVSGKSVAFLLTRKMRVKFARRDVFLDNLQDRGYIKSQIYQLKAKASLHGQAIGIGHDRETTLKVLKEVMPQLAKEGYKFVFVSELVR